MTVACLTPTTLRRDRRCLIVVPGETQEAIVLHDPTGDVELIVELLLEGSLTREGLVMRMTGRRDGLTAAGVSRILDALEAAGLAV